MLITRIIIAFSVCMLIFFSCKKENGDPYWGEVSVIKNDSVWSGKIKATKSNFAESKVEIIVKTFNQEDIPLETLGFFKVPTGVGKYKLAYTFNQPPDDTLVGALYANGYDDEIYDFFEIAENDSTSYIEITDYNESTRDLKGIFNLILWRQEGLPGGWNAPDSIVFANGVFHTRIND